MLSFFESISGYFRAIDPLTSSKINQMQTATQFGVSLDINTAYMNRKNTAKKKKTKQFFGLAMQCIYIHLKEGKVSLNLCDLLLFSLRAVAPTALFVNPIFINSRTSSVDLTQCMLASGTARPFGKAVFQIPSVRKLRKINF